MNMNENVFTKITELQNDGKFEELYGPDVLKQILQEEKINKGAIKKIFIALLKRDNVKYTIDFQQYWLRNEKSYKEMGDTITGESERDWVYKYYFYECGCILGEAGCEEAKNAILKQMGTDIKTYIEGGVKNSATVGLTGNNEIPVGKNGLLNGRNSSGKSEYKSLFGRTGEAKLEDLLLLHDVFAYYITDEAEESVTCSLPLRIFREKIDARKDLWDKKSRDASNKKGLSDRMLEYFPEVVQYAAASDEVRFDVIAYEKKRKELLSESLYYVLRELKNKEKYFHALNGEFLNLAREKGDKGTWGAVFETFLLRDEKDIKDNILLYAIGGQEKTELRLPERSFLQAAVKEVEAGCYKHNHSFAELGEELKGFPLVKFYMLQCGLIAGTEEDRKACLSGIETLFGEESLKEYRPYLECSLDFHFLRLCTAEQVQDYIAKNSSSLDDALRALLYALTNSSELFRQAIKDKALETLWDEETFSNKGYLSKQYFGKLLWTFEYMVREETVDVIDRCGRFLQRLVCLFPDTGLKKIRYEELLRNTIKGQKKETILENCIADFENIDAWDGFTKFYHSIDDNRMRDAGNMYELIRYPYTQVVQQSVLTNVQRSLERTVMGALPANFLDNSLYFLKWAELPVERNSEDVRVINGYWKEFVNQMNRHRFMADLESDKDKKEKVKRFFAYACEELEQNQKFPYTHIGNIVYTVLEQNRDLLCEFWENYFTYKEGTDCPFVRFLLAKNEDGKYRYSRQLFRFLMQSFVMIKNERDEKKREILKSRYVCFFKVCNVDGFAGQKHLKGRKAGQEDDYSRVIRVLAEFVEEKVVKRGIKKELLYAIVEDYPASLKNASSVVLELYRYQYSKEYLDAIEYVHNFYEGIFSVQEDLYLNLKRCLGYWMGSESRERGGDADDMRARVMTLLLKTGWDCCACSGKNTEKKFTDMMRFAKDMYALAELCTKEQLEALGITKDEIKSTVGGMIDDTAGLENYDKALLVLLSCEKMEKEIKTDVICYGLTNHWDPFVEAVGSGAYESSLVDVDVFDQYLRQIDYRKFRRSALQKIIRDLNGEDENLSMLEKRIIADNYVNSLVKFIGPDENSLTRVLYDAVVELKMAKKDILDSVSGLVLNRKYREWNNLETAIASFYEGCETGQGEESKVTKILSLLIKNSYYPEDMTKLIHSMACQKEKAVYAKYLLDSGAFHPVITEYRVNYYKTICNAVLGNAEDAETAYEACMAYRSIVEAQEENSFGDELFMDKDFVSRCNKKLEEHIILKARSGEEVLPDERRMRMELEPAKLFKFGFMNPVKPQKNEVFETNKIKFFKKETDVSEKCMRARYLYYWLVYGGYELENYADFLIEWALCEAENAKENEKIDLAGTVYAEFFAEQERRENSVFALKAEEYDARLRELFYRCVAEARIEMPRKLFDEGKLNPNNVRIGGKKVKELTGLTEGDDFNADAFKALLGDGKNAFGRVFDIGRRLSREEELSGQLEIWLNERDGEVQTSEAVFLENFRKEWNKRMNGDLEFTVLNKDEDAESLFFRVKNISGEDIEWIYLSVRTQDGTELVAYKIEELKKDGSCYGEARMPEGTEFDACEAVFYTELDDPENSVLCKYDKESWIRSRGTSHKAQVQGDGSESLQSVVNTVRDIIKDKKDKWLRLDKPYKAEDFVGVINEKMSGKARAIKIDLPEGEPVTEETLVQRIKNASGEKTAGNDLSDLRLESKVPLWVFCGAEDVNSLADIYIRQNRQVRFVFCGKEWTEPENKGWEPWIASVTIEATFTEQMERTRSREQELLNEILEYYFLDETLECMGDLGMSVEAATRSIDELCEIYAAVGRTRSNVYPSDLGVLKNVTVPMVKVLEEKNSVKEITALTVRRLPEDRDACGDYIRAIVKACGYETQTDIADLFGILRNYNDLRGAQIIGEQKNTQINNIINVFNMYNPADLEALADAKRDLAEAETKLKEAEERADAKSDEIEALKDAVQTATEKVEEAEEKVRLAETEKNEEIHKVVEKHKERFNLTTEYMAAELFGETEAGKVTELIPYMENNRVHKNAFENAIFVHYLFAKILEEMRGSSANGGAGANGANGNAGSLDYSPVNLMYGKLYEALLKSYHLEVYANSIGSSFSYMDHRGYRQDCKIKEVKVTDRSTGRRVPVPCYFDTLVNDSRVSGEIERITIGTFSTPILTYVKNGSVTTYPALAKIKSDHLGKENEWNNHKDRIDVIRNYRNGCAHSGDGQTTVGAITKTDVDALTKQLFELEGFKLIYVTAEVVPVH